MNNVSRTRLFDISLRYLHILEDSLLVIMLLGMIFLASAQILLRNLFDTSLLWADPLLQIILLWLGLSGALVASRYDKHIAIDVLYRIAPDTVQLWLRLITQLFTAAVCAWICWHATRFVIDEYHYSNTSVAGIPSWCVAVIIPLVFGLIAVRYLLRSGQSCQHALSKQTIQST